MSDKGGKRSSRHQPKQAKRTSTKSKPANDAVGSVTVVEAISPGRKLKRGRDLTTVDFWFDPGCPWAWLTSRWMLEVETVRPVKTVFHIMSLAVLNAAQRQAEGRTDTADDGWAPARVALAIERNYGQEQLRAFYTAIGTRFHIGEEPRNRETIEAALLEVGLPADMAELGYTGDNDDALRRSHHEGMDKVGYEVGTPVIHVNGVAWFGPVLTPRPSGKEAGRVFDAVLQLACFPGFYELKRTRSVGPIFD